MTSNMLPGRLSQRGVNLLEMAVAMGVLALMSGAIVAVMQGAQQTVQASTTQEGLATFAEQITGSIDIERMKRVSLRIEAVAMALDGADFLQVFKYFEDSGQVPNESFTSAQRVFRGVPTTGGCAFTKDTVYLRGLIGVHTFFRWALKQRKLRVALRISQNLISNAVSAQSHLRRRSQLPVRRAVRRAS